MFFGLTTRPLVAADKKEISITSSKVSGKGVLVLGEMEGKPLQMACGLSSPSCAVLKPGRYLMVKPADNGPYMDCTNVDIYRKLTANKADDKKVGVYCLGENDPNDGSRVEVPLAK
jgi:hypothetical protein